MRPPLRTGELVPVRPDPAASAATSTAHTLNSGIPETGSVASLVTALTLPAPLQWNGMKTVSGRTPVGHPGGGGDGPARRRSSRTGSPSVTPSRRASSGCISTNGAGAAAVERGDPPGLRAGLVVRSTRPVTR